MVVLYFKIISIITLTYLLAGARVYSSDEVILKSINDKFSLGSSLFLYEDKTNKLTHKDIQKPEFDQLFKRSNQEVPSFGVTSSTIWVKIIITNRTKEKSWILKNEVVWHDYFDFFSMDNGKLKVFETGDRRSFKKRDLNYRGFAFNISPKEKSIYYIKIKSKDDLSIPLEILTLRDFLLEEKDVMTGYALFYGAILIMVFYNLITYFFTRDSSYLYYSLTITAILWTTAAANGIAFQFLYPNSFWLQNEGFLLRGGLIGLFLHLFLKKFLLINKRENRRIYNILQINIYTSLIFILLSFFGIYRLLYFPFISFVIFAFCFIILAGLVRLKQGYRPARFYLLAFSGFSLGGLVQSLSLLGFIPPLWIVSHAFQIGNLFQTVFLAFALGDKFKRLQEEALEREIEARKVMTNFASKLEEQVRERTKELAEKNERLKEYDFAVAHDLANPIGVAITHIELYEHLYTENFSKTKEVIKKIKSSLEKSISIINNILINFTVDKVDLKKYKISEILNLALDQLEVKIQQKNAKVELDLMVQEFICNNASTIQIFANIISNSLKYSKKEVPPIIKIRSFQDKDHILIDIEDNGIGIKKDMMNLIFEKKGRVSESEEAPKGHGIGLYNVKKMVEENEAEISVKSDFGKGSIFTLKFKKKIF
ncbi:MAG: hypothetical protein CME68_07530 [Halobacteriovoraceae bacterium]|nr:hypothetical protein [Halobacteriovoraceae bacterium]